MSARFEITNCTAGRIEVVTDEGVQVWVPGDAYEVVGEQGTLWKGMWPRLLEQRPRPHLVRNIGGYAVELHEGTGPYKRPDLRVLPGGRT